MRSAKRPEEVPAVRVERWSESGDAVADTYLPDAVMMLQDGREQRGDELRETMKRIVALGVPPRINVRHTLVSGDTAMLVVDWETKGTAVDGTAVDLAGTAVDVVRRDEDGNWRYLIDNPFAGKPAEDGD